MSISAEWRCRVVELVEQLLSEANGGRYPATVKEAVHIVRRLGYDIRLVRPDVTPHAVTAIDQRVIILPLKSRDYTYAALIHELVEIMLRSPLQHEYIHPLSAQDEFHAISHMTAQRSLHRTRLQRIPVRRRILE